MKNRLASIAASGLVLWTTQIFSQPHPRILLNPQRVNEIKAAIEVNGSTHQQAFNMWKAKVDNNNPDDFGKTDLNWNYARSYLAQANAFYYLITGQQQYADRAFQHLSDVHNDVDPDGRLPESGYGLARATVGQGFAIAYDWCYNGWTQTQRDYVKGKIDLALDAWVGFVHANLGLPRISNWVAVCRGGELLMILCANEETSRADRVSFLVDQLTTHMANGYGPGGVSQEGVGYTGYGGIFLLPAVYALNSIGDYRLQTELEKHEFWKYAMYSGSNGSYPAGHRFEGWTYFLGNGVDMPKTNDEGWTSLLLGSAPIEELPYFKYYYDHSEGISSPGPVSWRYEDSRVGPMWAMIYYPESVAAKDPNTRFAKSFADEKMGGYYFRNQWKDESDICFSITGDFIHGDKAWDEADAFQISLIAHNTVFFSGPFKTKDANMFSSLLVDGKANASNNHTGKMEIFEPNASGGYVIIDGGSKYEQMGCTSAKRHCLVDMPAGAAPAIISTIDKVESPSNHKFTWNLNVGDMNTDPYDLSTLIDISGGTESGRSYFLLKGENNGYVKGWVMHPADAELTAGDPLKIDIVAANVDIWVVMAVGSGTPPQGTIAGNGLESKLSLNGTVVAFNAASNRIVTGLPDSQAPAKPAGLSVTKTDDHSVTLEWNDNSESDFASYNVYRSESQNFTPGPNNLVGSGFGQSAFTDSDLNSSTTFYYTVTAQDNWGNQSGTSFISASTQSDNSPPEIASITALSSTSVEIVFTEAVENTSAENSNNYKLTNNLSVQNASLDSDNKTIILTVSPMTDGVATQLEITQVADLSGNRCNASGNFAFFIGLRIYESFEAIPRGTISSMGAFVDGWGGPWSGSSQVVDVSSNPLSAGGLSGGNHAIRLSSDQSAASRPFFDNLNLDNYGELWLSYLLRWESDAGYSDKAKIYIHNTNGNWDWAYSGVETRAEEGDFILSDYYKSGTAGGPNFTPGQTVNVVTKIEKGQLTMWLNPQSINDSPLLSHGKGWSRFKGVGLSCTGASGILMDRIVVGTSFASVMSPVGEDSPVISSRLPNLNHSGRISFSRYQNKLVFQELDQDAVFQIVDIAGNLVYKATLYAQQTNQVVSVPAISKGLFVFQIKQDDGAVVTQKQVFFK